MAPSAALTKPRARQVTASSNCLDTGEGGLRGKDQSKIPVTYAHRRPSPCTSGPIPDVANSLNNLAGLYSEQGRYADAEFAAPSRPRLSSTDHLSERTGGFPHPGGLPMFALCSTLPGFERNNESQGSSA